MPRYQCIVHDQEGSQEEVSLVAGSEAEVVDALEKKGYQPLKISLSDEEEEQPAEQNEDGEGRHEELRQRVLAGDPEAGGEDIEPLALGAMISEQGREEGELILASDIALVFYPVSNGQRQRGEVLGEPKEIDALELRKGNRELYIHNLNEESWTFEIDREKMSDEGMERLNDVVVHFGMLFGTEVNIHLAQSPFRSGELSPMMKNLFREHGFPIVSSAIWGMALTLLLTQYRDLFADQDIPEVFLLLLLVVVLGLPWSAHYLIRKQSAGEKVDVRFFLRMLLFLGALGTFASMTPLLILYFLYRLLAG